MPAKASNHSTPRCFLTLFLDYRIPSRNTLDAMGIRQRIRAKKEAHVAWRAALDIPTGSQ